MCDNCDTINDNMTSVPNVLVWRFKIVIIEVGMDGRDKEVELLCNVEAISFEKSWPFHHI